jgi:Lrp/AsnC family transcriptional regulator, leucine-responsive regulatory protein
MLDVMPNGTGRKADRPRLDEVDRKLLLALSQDGRRPAAALAKELGLSRQAITERLRDLETRGVIRGYRADVDPAALGLEVRAQIRLAMDGAASAGKEREVIRRLRASPLVQSVFRVSGEDCFVAQVVCRHIEDVNALLAELKATLAIQSSRTAFVLETVLDRSGLGRIEPALLELAAEEPTPKPPSRKS